MLWQLTFFLLLQQWFQIQTYELLESRTKQNLPQDNWHVLFYCASDVCYTKF